MLNSPYTGATAAGVTIEYVTAALAAAANFGIKVTGIAAPFNVNTFRDYYANRFTATFSNASTLVTSSEKLLSNIHLSFIYTKSQNIIED